jgi:large repetitive protein
MAYFSRFAAKSLRTGRPVGAAYLQMEELEAREVPAATLPDFTAVGVASKPTYLVTSAGPGGGVLRVFDFHSQTEKFRATPFGPNYAGGIQVATGDVNGDGTPDIICATGTGAITTVRVFDGATGVRIASFEPFGKNYTSGASVAVGDFNGDGKADIVVGGAGHPVIKVFSGASVVTGPLATLGRFTAFGAGISTDYTGGVRVAVGDVNDDGTPDILAVTASGRAIVAGFSGTTIGQTIPFQPFAPYYATGANSTGGGWIAAGDVNGDGFADIAVGNGSGAAQVRIVDGESLPMGGNPILIRTISLGTSAATGVHARLVDLNGDGKLELVEGANMGAGPLVGIFSATTGNLISSFDAFDTTFLGGVYLG